MIIPGFGNCGVLHFAGLTVSSQNRPVRARISITPGWKTAYRAPIGRVVRIRLIWPFFAKCRAEMMPYTGSQCPWNRIRKSPVFLVARVGQSLPEHHYEDLFLRWSVFGLVTIPVLIVQVGDFQPVSDVSWHGGTFIFALENTPIQTNCMALVRPANTLTGLIPVFPDIILPIQNSGSWPDPPREQICTLRLFSAQNRLTAKPGRFHGFPENPPQKRAETDRSRSCKKGQTEP